MSKGEVWFLLIVGLIVCAFAFAVEEYTHPFVCPSGSEFQWVETPITWERVCVVRPVSR